jgi:hypothetical protein
VGKVVASLLFLVAFTTSLLALDCFLLFRPERLKNLLEQVVEGAIDGRLTFQSVSYRPFRGLLIHGFSFVPYDRQGSIRSVTGNAVVRIDPAALLEARLRVEELVLDRLTVDLERDPETGWTFPPILKGTATPRGGPLLLPRAQLHDGTISIRDQNLLLPGERIIFSGVEAFLNPQVDGKVTLTGGFRDRTFGAVDLTCTVTPGSGMEELKLFAEGLFPTETLRAKLNTRLASNLQALGAKGSFNAELTLRPGLREMAGPHPEPLDGEAPLPEWITLRLRGADLELTPPDFPYAFPDVEGTILLTPTRIELERLRARRGDTVIQASGVLTSYLAPDALTGELTVEASQLQVDSWLHRALPPPLQDAWDAIEPSGVMDLSVAVARDKPDRAWEVRADLDLRGLAATYHGLYSKNSGQRHGFPYPLRDLQGSVRHRDAVTTLNLQGRLPGGGDALIRGTLSGPPSEIAVDLDITATNLLLDDQLRRALPENVLQAYDRVSPTGQATAHIRIQRPRGLGHPTDVDVEASVRQTTLSYDRFPYRITDVEGTIVIGHQNLRVRNLRGRRGRAEVEVQVDLSGPPEDPRERVVVVARGIPIDDDLRTAAEGIKGMTEIWREFSPTGLLDATFVHLREGESSHATLQASVREGTAVWAPLPVALTDVSGSFVLDGTRLTLSEIEARRGAARITVGGRVSRPDDHEVPSRLDILARNLDIDGELVDALRTSTVLPGKVLTDLQPSGVVDFECRLEASKDTGNLAFSELVTRPRTLGITQSWIPGRFKDIKGTVTVTPGRVELSGIRGELLRGRIRADGAILIPPGIPPTLEATIEAHDLVFDDASCAAIEGQAAQVVQRFTPRGKLGSEALQLKVFSPEDRPDETHLRLAGAVDLVDMDINLGADFTREITGRLTIDRFLVTRSGHELLAHTHDTSARVLGYRVNELSSTIEASEREVRVSNIRGKLYGGTIDTASTRFDMHVVPPVDYGASLRARGIRLEKLIQDQRGRAENISGAIDLEFSVFRGEGEGLDAMKGQGKLRIYDARLFEVPGLSRLTSVVPVSEPPVFTEAAADFVVENGGLRMDDLEIYSVPLGIKGAGFIDFGGEMDFSLITRIAPDLPSIPILDLPISFINRTLFGIRVQGPVENPLVRLDNLIFKGFRSEEQPRQLMGLQDRRWPRRKRF